MNDLLKFLSNHFVEFFCANIVFLILFVATYTTIRVKEITLKKASIRLLRLTILTFIIVVEIFWFAFCGYVYWNVYRSPTSTFQLPDEIKSDTSWVEDHREIFMVHGEQLLSIQANGKNRKLVFKADDLIKEYHFSPDNKYVLILDKAKLYLYERSSANVSVIASIISDSPTATKVQGVISGISWASDSQKFIYEISRWSEVSSQDRVYIYQVADKKKRSIDAPARRVSSLIWDMASKSLYYLKNESKDTSEHAMAFVIHVFEIPLDTLKPKLAAQIPTEEVNIPINNLRARGINLFLEGDRLSFARNVSEKKQTSDQGAFIGIDKKDFMYYLPPKGWPRKPLFKVQRAPNYDNPHLDDYTGGRLNIEQMRWLPGGKYVIMKHRYRGVLILDPVDVQIGQLIEIEGEAFGWFSKL